MSKKPLPNFMEENALHTFRVTIRDREHFYKLVNWLNQNVGKGSDKWTFEGRVLRKLSNGKTVNPRVFIFTEDFDPSVSVYITLL